MATTQKSAIACIKEFFKIPTNELMKEIKALNAEEKLELAQGSAKNLGLGPDDINFELPA